MSELDRVLFVDDEPNLHEAVARGLRNRFEVHTATSGAEGLRLLQEAGPFAVVVSDMRMPEMNGAQFLARACERWPDTVRMILSGQADLSATIAAVNEGNLFRFLSKPCSTEQLLAAVGRGVEQHRLITSEKVLLEKTLSGAVGVLIDILGMLSPSAYSRAQRLERNVLAIVAALQLREQWQWPLAALVSQIGCLSLPKEALSRVEASQRLSDEEQLLFDAHPQLAGRLLEGIPRLEDVAAIVASQGGPPPAVTVVDPQQWDVRTAGIIMLRAASEFDRHIGRGLDVLSAIEALRSPSAGIPVKVIAALKAMPPAGTLRVLRQLRLLDLAAGMQLDEAIVTRKGACLVPAGQEVTAAMLVRLRSLAPGLQLQEPFRVQVPA